MGHLIGWNHSLLSSRSRQVVEDMAGYRFMVGMLAILLLASVKTAISGTCEHTHEIFDSISGKTRATFSNISVVLRPMDTGGVIPSISDVTFRWYGMMEVTRTNRDKCAELDYYPYKPEDGSTRLLKIINLHDLDCEINRFSEYAPGTNVQINTLQLVATSPLHPNTRYYYNISTAAKAGNYTFNYPQERVVEFEYVQSAFSANPIFFFARPQISAFSSESSPLFLLKPPY